ncbi:hypothetical protein UFOVP785_97 [uncultured Caudovirales phage]|uniref:Uncharacterized protein n=1 Tax=uncultured Caudovirales phage TaxID=2100421 RepID=A0A6J5P5B6_9CAUD|nr:hypothetical protein UFOVP785_97 [uncultured Caudovirales phage]
MTKTIDFHALESMSAWDVAETFGCHYSGDSNAIEHGGYFYDASDWEEYGYASCVEFWLDPDAKEDTLRILVGTINKPNDMSGPFSCCDTPESEQDNIHAQIDAVRSYCGIEPDDYQEFNRVCKLATWKEWRIWKSVCPLLFNLAR